MAITLSKLATLPTTDMANRDFMANNPQYAPKAPSTSSASQGTITDDKGITWNKDAYAQQQADVKKYFPTVMETGTKLDKTIPELQSQGNTIAQEINQSKVNKDVPKTEEQLLADAMKTADNSGMFEESEEMKQLQNMMKANLDAQTQASLSAIQQQYAQKEALMVKSQKASSKGLENVLNLGGSARYAPISSMGLVDAKNRYDLETLTQLHAEEEAAKSRVLQAQREGNFALMEKQMGRLETLRKDKLSFAQKISESIAKQNKEMKDRLYEEEKEFKKTLTDISMSVAKNLAPKEVREAVANANDIGEAVTAAGDYLQEASGDLGSYLYYKREAMASGKNYMDYMSFLDKKQQIESRKASASGGSGTGDTGFGTYEQFTDESLALSAIPIQLRNTEAEKAYYMKGVKLGLAKGKNPYQIADDLMGFQIDKPDDFSKGIRQFLSIVNLDKGQIQDVARLINSGNKAGAISLIENKAMSDQKKADPDSYVGESTARYYADKVAEIKKQIEDNGLMDAIGPLEGTAESISGRFKSGEAAKVMAKVTSLVAEMRNHLSGTAVTDSEKKFLEPLVASLYDKKGIFITKLDEIKDNSLSRLNQVRKVAQLPELYEDQLLDRNKRVQVYSQSQIIGDEILNEEEEQESALANYKKQNPSKVTEINNLISDMESILGRPIDASEFYQMYPQYK